MAGEALSPKFMLGSATIMIGAQVDLFQLGVAQSLGLVKNFSLKSSPSFTELTQGVKNSLVASIQTKNDVMADMEMYEYTPKNLFYALSLDGSAVVDSAVETTLTAQMPASGTPPETASVMPVVSATGITAGKFLIVHANSADQIFVRSVVSVSGLNVTINAPFPVSIPNGSRVEVATMVPIGSTKDNPYLAAKLVGQLADNSWATIYLPKVRVTSGISLSWKTDNFDNIPLQMTVYDLTADDPNYAYFLDADGFVAKAHAYF